ncbi:MAG: head GIN domain-containing protein [Saprospiraceae bacterium]
MKSTWPFAALLTLSSAFFLVSCDIAGVRSKGNVLTETRSAQDFHALDIDLCGKVIVLTGPEFKVEVQAEESALPLIETRVENGSLHVFFSRHVYDVDHLIITVTAPAFDAFSISGSATVICNDPLDGSALTVDISGSGDLELTDVNFEHAELQVSGSGDILLQGAVNQFIVFEVSGSGNLDALQCPTAKASVQVSGSGKVKCQATESLKARVSGSGDVFYSGNPALDVEISGSGKVRKI